MNIQDKKDLEKAISKLQKLKDDGVIPLFADGMLKAYNDLLPLVKKLTIPDVVKSFYCNYDDGEYNNNPCAEQCNFCKGVESLQ
jgi:hypothetical protein